MLGVLKFKSKSKVIPDVVTGVDKILSTYRKNDQYTPKEPYINSTLYEEIHPKTQHQNYGRTSQMNKITSFKAEKITEILANINKPKTHRLRRSERNNHINMRRFPEESKDYLRNYQLKKDDSGEIIKDIDDTNKKTEVRRSKAVFSPREEKI